MKTSAFAFLLCFVTTCQIICAKNEQQSSVPNDEEQRKDISTNLIKPTPPIDSKSKHRHLIKVLYDLNKQVDENRNDVFDIRYTYEKEVFGAKNEKVVRKLQNLKFDIFNVTSALPKDPMDFRSFMVYYIYLERYQDVYNGVEDLKKELTRGPLLEYILKYYNRFSEMLKSLKNLIVAFPEMLYDGIDQSYDRYDIVSQTNEFLRYFKIPVKPIHAKCYALIYNLEEFFTNLQSYMTLVIYKLESTNENTDTKEH
ncbi:uncharacterized protein LOC130641308 [Hydractinia symbiolongicarpus]|uniref:uncharacterized protein LOC130641308 n=1 Tax=Hydractinia symbiolongicarpus TaxID=13093 RepID=UPI00254AA337|nr:uncharacterized protein LOC130641308 [Hydractinia symbiolongicarpus]